MAGIIQLQTEIPGPRSRALLARRARAVPRGVPAVTPIAVVHAEGAVLTDADGNRLIDFAGGIGVVNTLTRLVAAHSAPAAHFDHGPLGLESRAPGGGTGTIGPVRAPRVPGHHL